MADSASTSRAAVEHVLGRDLGATLPGRDHGLDLARDPTAPALARLYAACRLPQAGIIGPCGPSGDRQPAQARRGSGGRFPRACRSAGDLAHPVAVHPQPDDFVMGTADRRKDALPELAALRSWLGRAWAASPSDCDGSRPGNAPLQRPPVLLVAIGEPAPGDPAEKGLQLRPTGEMPATVAHALNQVGKHRLDDVSRIDLGPQAG